MNQNEFDQLVSRSINRYDQFTALVSLWAIRSSALTDFQAIDCLHDAMQIKLYQLPDNIGTAAKEFVGWIANGKPEQAKPEWMNTEPPWS